MKVQIATIIDFSFAQSQVCWYVDGRWKCLNSFDDIDVTILRYNFQLQWIDV